MTILKGVVDRKQGWRAFIKITSIDGRKTNPWYFELPLDRFPIEAGEAVELRIGETNVNVGLDHCFTESQKRDFCAYPNCGRSQALHRR